MIVWREKLIATAIHFGVTLTLASIAAALIFFVWFPHPFEIMIGGLELFVLVVGCDVVLGPLLSLVLYNSRKTRLALVTDYTLIAILQIAALVYGVYVVAGTRPVYVAFNTDRFEIVTARDINDAELAAAHDPRYRGLPWMGPEYVAVSVPPEDAQDAMFQALSGNEEHQRPKFFVPFETQLETIRARAKELAVLAERKPEARSLLEEAAAKSDTPADRLEWLPVRHRNGFWTVLIDTANGKPVRWVDLDPYE